MHVLAQRLQHTETPTVEERMTPPPPSEMGAGQVVFGTDTPFNWPVSVDPIVNNKFLSNAEKEAVLGGNLAKVLRITT